MNKTTPTTTDRHMPLRDGHVVVMGGFTPRQKRRIALAFNGKTGNKAQAQAEGVGTDAIQKTWEHIADKMHLPWGQRQRQHVMAELCRRHLVEFICFVLVILPLLTAVLGDDAIDMRTRRGGRSRRGRFDNSIALDIDTLDDITDWPAWLQQQQQRASLAEQTGGTIALACTPIASIAIGSATGIAIYISASWPGAGHTGTEIAAELAGCAVGLITHRRTNF